jgi:hypothetical protein
VDGGEQERSLEEGEILDWHPLKRTRAYRSLSASSLPILVCDGRRLRNQY